MIYETQVSSSGIYFDNKKFQEVLGLIEARAALTENDPEGPAEEFSWLRSCGALGIVLPGGVCDFENSDTAVLLKMLKEIGKANLSVGRIFEGHINTLYLIHLFASEEQKKRWYRGVREAGHLFGIWNTQDTNGVEILYTKHTLELNGKKTFCSGAKLVNKALITGNINFQDRKGWQMAIVDMDRLGREMIDEESWKPLGMKASGSYNVDFSGYCLSGKELLGMPDIYLRQPYFNGGAIRFAAVQLGGAEALVHHTIKYLKDLGRTDDVFQRLRISNITSALISGRLWLNQAGTNYDLWVDSGEHEEELIAFANMTRVNIEEICLSIMDDCNRCIGARGLMEPLMLSRIFRDLTFYLRQPAPDATRIKIAEFFINQPLAFHD